MQFLKKYLKNLMVIVFLLVITSIASAGWKTISLDSLEPYRYTSIALDNNNKIHISYASYGGSNGKLKYVTNASGDWVYVTIDNVNTDVMGTSIAVDHNNKVHIAYIEHTSTGYSNLKYATNASGSWVILESESGKYSDLSIAIDGNNKVHISYYDTMNTDLKYATNVTGSWIFITLDSVGIVGAGSSIAIDSNNKVYISYTGVGDTNALKYATNITGSWVISTIANDNVGETSIAIDSNNKVHIIYYYYYLKYGTNVSGSWVFIVVNSADIGSVGDHKSITIDSNNKIHISYYHYGSQYIKYTTNISGEWSYLTLDKSGADISSAIDGNNKVYICSASPTGAFVGIKYAIIDNSRSAPVLSWTGETDYASDGVNPDVVNRGSSVQFRVKWTDVDGDAPDSGYPKVTIKKGTSEIGTYTMQYVSGDNRTGAIYSYTLAFSSYGGEYTYYFSGMDEWHDVAVNTAEKTFTVVDTNGIITGKVTKADGVSVVSGVGIQLLQNGVIKAITTTDSGGNYSTEYASGTYDVMVTATGYSVAMQTGKVITVSQTTVANFTLKEGGTAIIVISDDSFADISISSDIDNVYFSFSKRTDIVDGIGYELIMKDKNSGTKLDNFAKPITLTIHWTIANGKVANTEVSEYEALNKLSIYYYDGVRWQKVGGLVDPVNQTVSVITSKAGVYAIKSSASVSYGGRILVYPNPFTPNNDGVNDSVVFYFDAGTVQPVIKVYNGSGRVVRTLDGVVSWDGKDDSGSVVEAGLYLYHFRLGDLNKTGTVVVAK